MPKTQEEIDSAAQRILERQPGIEIGSFACKMGFPVNRKASKGGEPGYRLTDRAEAQIRILVENEIIEIQQPTATRSSEIVYLFGQVPVKRAPRTVHDGCTTTMDPYLKGSWNPALQGIPPDRMRQPSPEKETPVQIEGVSQPEPEERPPVEPEPVEAIVAEPPPPVEEVSASVETTKPSEPKEQSTRKETSSQRSVRRILKEMIRQGVVWNRNKVCAKAGVSGSYLHGNVDMAREYEAAIDQVMASKENSTPEPEAIAPTTDPKVEALEQRIRQLELENERLRQPVIVPFQSFSDLLQEEESIIRDQIDRLDEEISHLLCQRDQLNCNANLLKQLAKQHREPDTSNNGHRLAAANHD